MEKEIQTIKLNEYHTLEYLKKISKGRKTIYILPNGKEVAIDGK